MGRNLSNLYISQSFEYLVQISGSEFETGLGSTITSVNITASNAVSASHAITASYALNAGTTVSTASLLTTASAVSNSITFTKGDSSQFTIIVATGSAVTVNTGSLLVTASISNATTTFSKGDGTTFSLTTNNVVNADSASFAAFAVSSSNSATSISSSYSSVALSSSFATSAQTATSASFATSAATATTASFASTIASGLNITASNLLVNNNLTVNGTASFGYFEAVTGSVVRVGESFILLNTSDTTRYAGLLIEDSGSSTPINYTASWFYDSQTNDWNYEYNNAGDVDFAVALFGPAYDTKGTPTYLTTNKIPVASGSHHLKDSTITDSGTNVTFSTPIAVSGTLSVIAPTASGTISNIGRVSFETGYDPGPAAFRDYLYSSTNDFSIGLSGYKESIRISPGEVTVNIPFRASSTTNLQGNTTIGDSLSDITNVTGSLNTTGSVNISGLLNVNGQINQGQNNVLSGSSIVPFGTIIASTGSSLLSNGTVYEGCIIAGGKNNIIKSTSTNISSPRISFGIFGGQNLIMSNGDNSESNTMIGGGSNTMTVGYGYNTLIGGANNGMANNAHSILVGGINNYISADYSLLFGGLYNQVNGGYFSPVLGGSDNRIGGGAQSSILGGTAHRLNSGDNSSIIGGNNHTVSHSGSVIIGGSYMSTAAANTVYVPNLVVSGSLTGTVVSSSYAISSSFATSASFATTALTASFFGGIVTSASYAVTGGGLIAGAATAMRSAPYLTTVPATASGANSIALGNGAYTLGGGTVAIGNTANAQALRSVAIGNTVMASGANAVAIGYNITASGTNAVNINGIFNFDGTNIRLSNSTIVTGSVTATSFTGSLFGTASFATTAATATTASFYSLAAVTQNAVFSGSVRGEVKALTITSNTASMDCSLDNFFTLTLVSGSNTLISPTNIAPGQTINLQVTQANPGNGTVSFPTSVKQVSGSSYVPSTGAGPVDIVTFISFDASSLYLSNVKNLI